jgi:hypothetical protein
MEPRNSGTKQCKKCLRELPVLAFPVQRHNKDGLCGFCRECVAENGRKWHVRHAKPLRQSGFSGPYGNARFQDSQPSPIQYKPTEAHVEHYESPSKQDEKRRLRACRTDRRWSEEQKAHAREARLAYVSRETPEQKAARIEKMLATKRRKGQIR